jgi:chitosanase
MSMLRREFLLALPAVFAGLAVLPRTTMATEIDPALKIRIKAITNVFEVGKPEADYAYIEDLKDGRGFTCTNYGFVTREREVAEVIKHVVAAAPGSPLKDFLPRLPPKARGSDTHVLHDFPAAWAAAAQDLEHLSAACELVADRIYFNPAMKVAERFNMASPIGRSIVYDTILQHGDGDDKDGLRAIYKRVKAATAGAGEMAEADLLFAFLEVRRDVLLHPANKATAKDWRESVTRVDALQNLLAENPSLLSPVRVRNSETDTTVE